MMAGRKHQLTVLCLMVVLAGCSNESLKLPPIKLPVIEPDRTTIAGLFDVFQDAHQDREIDSFAECLHPEYIFWFSEDDRDSPSWNWNDFINKIEDRDVTDEMFEAEIVTDIQIDFTNLTFDPDTLDLWIHEDTGDPEPFTYYWGVFAVDMHVVEQTEDGLIDHWVDGRARMYVRPDPAFEGLWTIWKIEDLGNEHKATDDTSWSGIKALFRK
ncbi:MAG: hypothetical protein KAW17_07635 [Candidatus Eisenbacteria sp.]|nr:hypothetical protein [Candidatus Eisenbacteria bacterium]